MRCRYCNKAISLLRRLNDAKYCSDAHRFDDAAEQQLAMQRLAETQPAMQRTQRMAAAKPGVSHAGTMTAKAGLVPFSFPAINGGWRMEAAPESLATSSTVLFMDRDHRFLAGMPWSLHSVPVPVRAAARLHPPTAVLGPYAKARIVTPRGLALQPRRRGFGNTTPVVKLFALIVPPIFSRNPASLPLTMEPALKLQWPPGPRRRRERELGWILRLAVLTMPPAGPDARKFGSRSRASNETSIDSLFHPPGALFPVSRLRALAPPLPGPKDDGDELWALFEASPLAALLAATHYPTLEPAAVPLAAPFGAGQPPEVVFAARPAAFPEVLATAGSCQPAKSFGLQTIGAPAAAAITGRRRAIQKVIETPVARRLPEWRATLTRLSLNAREAILPVRPPEVAAGIPRSANLNAAKAIAPPSLPNPQPPKWSNAALARLSLDPCGTVFALPPPEAALGRKSSFWDDVWASTVLPERLPSAPRGFKPVSLIAARGGSVPPPKTAGVQVRVNSLFAWIGPVAAVRPPASRIASVGDRIALASRVSYQLRPNPVDAVRAPHSRRTLHTVLRVRIPSQSQRLVSRYGSAECVPLAPPCNQPIPWRAAIVSAASLSPDQVFPPRRQPAQNCALRHLPLRLFPVPRAKPMARPASGKPLSLGMDLWASPPAVRAANLRFDDGKRRSKQISTQRFGQELRERFSQDGLHNAWTKVSRLPSDLKWIAMVVPLVLGIWVLARPMASEPASAKMSIPQEELPVESAPVTRKESKAAVSPVPAAPPLPEKLPVSSPGKAPAGVPPFAEPGRWEILNARIASRASIDLVEDFRNGLSQWEGRGEWARSWSYDQAGTVRPGQMAFFQPTLGLRDYVLEMKASIDRRSIQWMVRASGPQNYHFARLNVTPGAPLTKLELERWSVINGRTTRVTRLPLPHGGANQTLYSIRVEVSGDSITTYLQDQVIDTFNDSRLREGGVGLIGAQDDRARIYGIRVSHQNDFLGKLCSLLSPPPINSQGSD